MLTDEEMLIIAEKYLKKAEDESGIEVMIFRTIEKSYGNIYEYLPKKSYHIGGAAPFLVEKKTGRVVQFGSAGILEIQLKAYENGTMSTALDTYWYPDEDRFDYK
ncbi:hypothetical protein [Chryseobacterium sp. VD8]|uniref:hypothetical protein n=1 Tax=Chryseobacterium sp. VD8 TaxID=3081254 RepID=UPI00301A9E6C